MIIRLATDDDWPSIWSFFEAIVREGETYTYPTDLTSEKGRSLWLEPPPSQTVVFEDRGTIAGSAKMGPNRPGPRRPHRNRQFHGVTGSTWPRYRTIAR